MTFQFKHLHFFQSRLNAWFDRNGRDFPWRNPKASDYQKVISEILLQRTRAESVANFLPIFFMNYPSWEKLADADETKIREIIRPVGLWKQKTNILKSLSQELVIRKGIFPSNRDDLERLPGIGQYIASAILLLIYNRPEPLLDVNMQRVLERFFGPRKMADIRYDPYLQELSRKVISTKNPVNMNYAILDYGALVCRAIDPYCETCSVNSRCKLYITGRLLNS